MFYDANIGKDGEKGRTCSGREQTKSPAILTDNRAIPKSYLRMKHPVKIYC